MIRPRTIVQVSASWSGVLYYGLSRRMAPWIALGVVLGALTVLGCGGGGGGTSVTATATDLTNQAFTFSSGAGPNLASVTGLPQGQAFTLQFGSLGVTDTGPLALTSANQTASGTISIVSSGSCTFLIAQSTFPAGTGPQAGSQFTLKSCTVDSSSKVLQLTTSTGETVVSSSASARPTTNVAFVLTTNIVMGSYSLVDLAARTVSKDIQSGGIHNDAVARLFNAPVYVVNRLGVDSIQILDPQLGFITPANGVLSVGNGTNPQDIAFLSPSKAYVSRLGSARLLIINPTTLESLGELDCSSLVKPNDSDGRPEAASMLVHNGLVYVALQHIDFNTPFPPTKVARGEVAVIDPATDTIVQVIQLHGKNPFSAFQFSPTLQRILISSVGDFTVHDGGIEAIDPATNTVDPQFVITEAIMGGDITAFVIMSRTKGFAVVSDANFANSLVTFDPSRGIRLRQVVGPLQVAVPHVALNSRNEVYLAVTDTKTSTSGLRIFDALTDLEITKTPLNVGQFPPSFTLFIE